MATELTGRRALWRIAERVPSDLADEVPGGSHMLAHLLYMRGYRSSGEIADFFLHPIVDHDPFALPDMERAIDRIRLAVSRSEDIAVYGDFDCDGLTASVVLVETLRMLGIDPRVVIPTRASGHGLRETELRALRDAGVSLVISADCGIGAIDEVRLARSLGLDVIITDHHDPPRDGSLPDCPVVSPSRLDSSYPCPHLCGVGVTYKVAQTLLGDRCHILLDLVALGTVADVVPLRGENRGLVVRGLSQLRETRRPGLRALLAVAGVQAERVTPESVGFYLAPRINAANRMADPRLAYDLLTATDSDTANRIAAVLNQHNRLRQTLVDRHLAELTTSLGGASAITRAVREGQRPPIIFVEGEWPSGISGLLAGKLVDVYGLPAIAAAPGGDGVISASARSVPGVHIAELLESCAAGTDGGTGAGSLFLGHGGHSGAAGFSVDANRLSEARATIERAASVQVPHTGIGAILNVDAEVRLSQVNAQAVAQIERLAPFGEGFEDPLFLARGIYLNDRRRMGREGKHLRGWAQQGSTRIRVVFFNHDEELSRRSPLEPLDAVFSTGIDGWRGNGAPEIYVKDWRPHEPGKVATTT